MKLTLVLLTALVLSSVAARAQSDRTITVLSTGTATAAADHAQLQLTVSSMDQTAMALFVKQKDIVGRLRKALVGAGVKASDISESPIRLLPNYEYGQNGTRIIGYRAETPLSVDVEDVASLPQLIDLAAQSGAGMISLGSFTKSVGDLHADALKNAVDGARKEATILAREMGRSLGDIVSITQVEDAGDAAKPRAGSEEEEERERGKAKDQNSASTLTEKAELRVTFQVK
jgi:uncharacterized protein YggE